MKLKPLYDRIIVKRSDKATLSRGGIIIPASVTTEEDGQGTVIRVGEGYRLPDGTIDPLRIKEGDKVVFKVFGGTKLSYQGEEYLVLKENDVIGVEESE